MEEKLKRVDPVIVQQGEKSTKITINLLANTPDIKQGSVKQEESNSKMTN